MKSRDITLATKVHLVKAVVFLVVMYRCESWTIKKTELSSSVQWVKLYPSPGPPPGHQREFRQMKELMMIRKEPSGKRAVRLASA